MSILIGSSEPERIVVFRALQLGDMLCSVPALRALRRATPHARIALIGLPWAQSFVERYSDLLDELIVFPGARGFPEQREDDSGLPGFTAAMRERHFDLAIQLHGSGGVANDIVGQFAARAYAGFVQPGEARDGCFIAWPETLPEPHRYLTLTDALGAPRDSDTLAFEPTPQDLAEHAALVAMHRIASARLVVVHPGAQLPSRRWPVERFAHVADALAADGWRIAITGTASELSGRLLGTRWRRRYIWSARLRSVRLPRSCAMRGSSSATTPVFHILRPRCEPRASLSRPAATRDAGRRSTDSCIVCSPTIRHVGRARSATARTDTNVP
jgi:hypothetical protein